jgi:uncharacterized membrane protein
MLGIPGLDPFGLLHALFGLGALLLGLGVVLRRKGTAIHRRIGYAYVATMLLLNASALAIYDLYGGFGPFHVAALVSVATVGAALIPAITRRPKTGWLRLHAELMAWSYVGLVSAFFAEIAVRLPGVGVAAGAASATAIGVAGGAALIYRLLPRAVARVTPSSDRGVRASVIS